MALSASPDMHCVGHAGSISGCIDLALTELPDVFILDYQLLEGNGLECAFELRAAGVKSRLIMLTANPSSALVDQAAAAGITGGVLSKHTPLGDVLAAVRDLAAAPF